jgi:DtxR family transcriptional regulator, Mn-dependent transcriptional regulator
MASSTVEDYLKRIYLEQQGLAGALVPMGRLATAMQVVPGTATSMVKALADSGLVVYEPRTGARLTKGGEQLALHVLRRHRLVELFLVEALGLDWSEVHQEAEELEHAISDKVLERIDQYLGHPAVDPHGDPIPSAKGKVDESPLQTLAESPVAAKLRIARVMDQDPPFLQFLDRSGLTPGTAIVVTGRDAFADSISLRAGSAAPITLGTSAALKILVEPA